MIVMNYSEMLHNASVVKRLANKTIECSQDYIDSQKDDIVDQMMDYLMETVRDVLASDIHLDSDFRKIARYGHGLSFADFGGDGTGAAMQFFYNNCGTYVRVFFNENGYWYADKKITNYGLQNLIKDWPVYKQSWSGAIANGIQSVNQRLSQKLAAQLELHEAVKNFQI